jgi:membrane protein DedA with SNARE-associated domain/protein-S-isoprenylcysteine O-methyltransferase Ste14
VSDLLRTLEALPPGLLYTVIGVLAAIESVFPPVPADSAVALGALLAGRGTLNGWVVFGVTWVSNVASAAAVYWVGHRYGRDFFRGRIGRRLLPEPVLAHIAAQYHRHGTYGIFLSRLLPVWRSVVAPFAGVAGLSAPRLLIPLALASGLWYGALTLLVATLGTNLETVVSALARVNHVLGAAALVAIIFLAVWTVRRLKAEAAPPVMTTETPQATSGIRFPPPLIYAGAFVVGYALHRFVPLRPWAEAGTVQRAVGWCLVAVWVPLSVSAVFLFRRAGTTPNPFKPTTALVLYGPYRFTRNPMYLGLAALYLGLTLLVNSLWPLLLFPAVIALIQTQVIAREEAYLEARFGEEYRAYKARVRRWM